MRVAVYTDYPYRREGTAVYAERAFVVFLGELSRHVDRLVLLGRLYPSGGRGERSHYRVREEIDFVGLPFYASTQDMGATVKAFAGSARAFWRSLDDVDAVWLLGPHPLCLVFALLAALRGKRVCLGVRQDLPAYVRSRHPGRRVLHVAGDLLEGSYRLLARICPTVVVGPALGRKYRHARRVLPITVSLVHEADVEDPRDDEQAWTGERTVITVGRLDAEKNPLLLADVLAALGDDERSWRLVVCGEGPMAGELDKRLERLGVADRADLRGYVAIDGGLAELYRESDLFLHVSWTEGLPQVLFEAFAAGIPVVATSVGGVPEAATGAAELIPAGDATAAAEAIVRLARDGRRRAELVTEGTTRAREHTIEAESGRVARFLAGEAA